MDNKLETAVFAGGCFWCTEAVFQELKGVKSVTPGYAGGPPAGGDTSPPSYEDVCTGMTGHAEVIKIDFDPGLISYRNLLTVFFATHDPSSLNKQGNDVGTQYRSIILYSNESQMREAKKFIEELNESSKEGKPIVTELKPMDKFYEAENYHKNYYRNNSNQPYCQLIINPKLKKVQEKFSELLKKNSG
jgi:peptide-methionine (S)-S-oxide reductase